MTIEGGVIERLGTITDVVALVVDRIYQLKLPQQPVLPAVRVQLIDEIPSYHTRGQNNLIPTRVQVDAYAAERSGYPAYVWASRLAAAIDGNWQQGSPVPPTGLSGWRGHLGGSPPSLFVHFMRRIDKGVDYEADELRLMRIRQDYLVWWKPV